MDVKKPFEIGILFLVCIGASEMLLFCGILISRYGFPILFSSRVGQIVLFMLVIFIVAICLYTYQKLTRKDFFSPIDERSKDLKERILDINLPFHQAFDLCRQSICSLPGGGIQSADEHRGIIKGWAHGPSLTWVGTPVITITLRKVEPGITHAEIHLFTPYPTPRFVPRLIDSYFSPNERYTKRICEFLQKYSKQPDGTLPLE